MSTIFLKTRAKGGRWAAALGVVWGSACASDPGRPGATAEDPFAGLSNRTAVVGYEYGRCETNADCVAADCGGATCAPPGEEGVCRDSPVAACLAELDPGWCGCYRGSCRWERVTEVQMCAILGDSRPMNRPTEGNVPNTFHRPHFAR